METVRTVIICIIVIIIYNFIFGDDKEKFASEQENTATEAVQNVASMYNPDTGTLKLTNLELTGGIKAVGQIWSEAAVVSGTNGGNHLYITPTGINQKTEGDTLVPVKINTGVECTGNGTFASAFVGNSPHKDWAQFSHKDNKTGENYALINHSDGSTLINSGNEKHVGIRNKNSEKFNVQSNGEVKAGNKRVMAYGEHMGMRGNRQGHYNDNAHIIFHGNSGNSMRLGPYSERANTKYWFDRL